MQLGGSMQRFQGLSNNLYPNPNPYNPLRFILILSSHLPLGLSKGLFPIGIPVEILNALLPSSILTTWPAHLNILI